MSEKIYQGCEPRIIERVPIHLKMVLTIREAAEYSNIGINKIESMLRQPNCPFVPLCWDAQARKAQGV